MAQFEEQYTQDLTQGIKIRQCGNIVFNGDNLSNVIRVSLYNGTTPATLSGTVVGTVICSDGSTVPVDNGAINGNTVTLTLTEACFAIPGQIGVGIQIVSGTTRTTIFKGIYNVERLTTDNVVDPDSRITLQVGDLIDDIETAIASIPSSYTDLMAAVAPTFDTSTAYTAGQYVWYDSKLYQFTTDHASGSWNAAQVELAVVTNDLVEDVTQLKIAVDDLHGGYGTLATAWEHGTFVRTNGNPTTSGYQYRIRTSNAVSYKDDKVFVIDSNYVLSVLIFDTNGFVSIDDYQYSVVLKKDTLYKFSIRKQTEDTSSTANISEFEKSVCLYELLNDGLEYIAGNWANGKIDYSTGGYYHSSDSHLSALSTPYFVTLTKAQTYTIKNGYSLNVNTFDNSGNVVGTQTKYVGECTLPANTKLRLMICLEPENTNITATQDYRKQVFKSYDTSLGTYTQNTSDAQKERAFKNLGNSIAGYFAPMAKLSKNVFDPYYLKYGYRADVSTGKDVATTDYNIYALTLQPHTQALCSCVLDNNNYRSKNYAVRSNVVYDANGTMLSANTSDNNSFSYVNDTDNVQIVKFNIWSDTNSTHTVSDFMIEVFPDTFSISGYETEYVPFGMELSQSYTHMIGDELHNSRDFFANEIEDTVSKVNGFQSNVNYTFAFVTDTHYDPASADSLKWTIDTFSNLKTICNRVPINAIYHGGDWLTVANRTQDEANELIGKMRNWMMQCNVLGQVHLTPGNHDGINGGAPASAVLYSPMMTQDEALVSRVGNSYNYYIDIAKPKLRMIVANDCNPPETQHGFTNDTLAWLGSTLASVPSGYNVILVSHIGPQSDDFVLNRADTLTLLNGWTGGTIVAWIVGHQHYDWIVPSSVSGCDFPVVVCTCSMRNAIQPSAEEVEEGAVLVSPRTILTSSQDAWTVFVYRPDQGIIHKVRFGAGSDADIDYANWQ